MSHHGRPHAFSRMICHASGEVQHSYNDETPTIQYQEF